MDQVKTGKFIATIRKGKGMTQKQLADEIGVSDKTISKWETGNGMPELSSIMPLCQVLQVNVNELLSGEHLSDDSYSRKAEENMVNLIQETEKNRQENKNSLLWKITILLLNLATLAFVALILWMPAMGHMPFNSLLDIPTFLAIILVTALLLNFTGQWKPFWQSFKFAFGKKQEYTSEKIAKSNIAVKYASTALLMTGMFITVLALIMIFFTLDSHSVTLESALAALAISLFGILYGCFFYLVLLPIRSRLAWLQRESEDREGKR